jgi:hypothetical protein
MSALADLLEALALAAFVVMVALIAIACGA